MFKSGLKRKKFLSFFLCLTMSLYFTVSCAPPPVVVSSVILAKKVDAVINLISVTYNISVAVSNLVDGSYQDLGEKVRKKDFSTGILQSIESKYSELSEEHGKLSNSLNQTTKEAGELFSLLQSNADENTTPELKEEMLKDINVNKAAFDGKVSIAEGASSQISGSIRKYKDILGFLQNKATLKDLDGYIDTIDKTIVSAKVLNQDVQTALVEGRKIIQKYQEVPPPNDTPSPEPTPVTKTRPLLGVQMVDLTPEIREKINAESTEVNLDLDQGALVTEVSGDSPASKSGIKPGDVILEINNRVVSTVDQARNEIGSSALDAELVLKIRRNRQDVQISAKLSQ
jgi:hypothetical protein